MAIPPILAQFTAADVQRYLRSVTGTASNFTPTNLLNTMVLPDRAVDVVAGMDLYRQPGLCRRVAITDYGSTFPLWGLEATQGGPNGAWACQTIGPYSFNGSHAMLTVEKITASGVGGYGIGCLKGPNNFEPVGQGGGLGTYGSDRGWAKSYNGSGLKGIATYGTENIGNQDARVFRPNVDFGIGTTSGVGRGYRCEISGYDLNYGGAGVAGAYLWTADGTQQIFETFDAGGAVGNAGDTSSPDGRFGWGSVMYGANALSEPWTTYVTGILAYAAFFTGAAADAVHANKTAICAAIQATL